MSDKSPSWYSQETEKIRHPFFSSNQTSQIDKIFEEYSRNISYENLTLLTSDSDTPNTHELDDLESNLEGLIMMLEESNGTPGANHHAKYSVAQDFLAKYS